MTSWKPAQSFFQKEIRGNLILLNPHDIVRIPECQPRVDGTDKKLVDDYAQDMRDYDAFYADHDPPIQGWQKFPRISCVHDPQVGYILFSGNHRLEAILQVGYAEIEIHYFTGTRQDAIVVSKKENASNGKRRTNADKAHVVKSCLLDDELKMWSNSTIAKWCGVSHPTVAKHEKALETFSSANGEPYTRPTRRKRLSNAGEIEWVETASIGNGNPEKPNRKELKRKHHSAVVNVQSAFFTADLHEHESFSHIESVETGLKAQEFFRRIVSVKQLQLNIFAIHSEYEESNPTNAEMQADIEVLEDIASQVRWYGESEEHHLGWIESVLEMEPEQQEAEEPTPVLESEWENEWLPRLKEVFIEKGYDPETIHPSIYKAVHGDQKTQIYDMSDAQLTALISQSKTVFNWKDNPENWITNRGESKIGWALRLLEGVTAAQETKQPPKPSKPTKTESPKESVDRRENGCRARLHSILKEHYKLDSTTYDVGALAKEFELYAVRVEVIARDLVSREIEKAQGNWQKAWTKVRTAWFDYEELSKSVEWETFTAAVLEQTDMVFLTKDTFENPDNRLNSNDLELLANEQNCLTTLGYHVRNPSFWVRDLIPKPDEQPIEQTEKGSLSLSEKTEALKGEVKEYLPTWKQNNPDTIYATLFHLLDARFRIKHSVPRGRNPFFFEELDDLLPLMKANDTALADKVREILATDSSGVKSIDTEQPTPPTESVADVLGGDSLAFITVALREPKPTGISGKGRLNYITFDAEDDRMQSCIDISEIPEPLLVQLIAIAKEKS